MSLHAQTTYNIYFGDIHSQTWYSDGNQDQNEATYTVPVAKAITYARGANNMDFLGVSDHNHNESLNMTHAYWVQGNHEADSVNQDGVFVGMRGQEWGVISGGGHVLVYGTDKLFGWNPGVYDIYVQKSNYGMLFDSLRKYGGFGYLAHPQTGDYSGIFTNAYNALWDSVVQGVAMKNGPATSTNTSESDPSSTTYESKFHDLLRLGYHVAPIANQDNHNTTFGRANQQRTVVLATSLTRANIVDALRNRRAYATEDHNLQVRLVIGTHQMGEIITQASPLPITVKVVDPDNSISSIVIRYGRPGSGVAPTTLTSNSGLDSLGISQAQAIGDSMYYYAYVTNNAGRRAWSAPIWVKVPTGPVPQAFNLSAPATSSPNLPVSGTLSWAASTDATQYDVYLGTNNPPTTLVSADQAGTSYNYSGLLNSTLYRWKVVAKNTNGTVDATSSPWNFTTIVASPSSFSQTTPNDLATNQPVSGTLSWQSSASASQYDVYLDTNATPTTLVSADQPGTTYDYSGLLNTQNYHWKIVAKNIAGNVIATGAPWMFGTIGPSPSSFTMSLPGNGATDQSPSGNLVWHSASLATNYDIYLDGNNPPTTLVATGVTDTTSAYGPLTPGATYYWKIIAKNGNGQTVASNGPRNFIINNVPVAVTNVASSNVTLTALQLTWTDNAANENGYRVYHSVSSSGPFTQLGGDLPANTQSISDSGLNINQRYYYRVVPFNAIGEGTFVAFNLATQAVTPGPAAISNVGYVGVTVTIDPAANPAATEFAVHAAQDTFQYYVQANGSLGASPAWQTYAQWGSAGGSAVNGLHPCLNYAFTVTARNLDNVPTSAGAQSNQTLPCFNISQTTAVGWNLMSLSVTVPDTRKTTVFPSSASDAFFYKGSYVRHDSLEYGSGFWLKFDASQALTLGGEPRLVDTIPVSPGWNIIGAISNPIAVGSLTTNPAAIIASNYFGYNGGYFVTDSIRPLQGYWVKSNASGHVMFSSSGNTPMAAGKNSGMAPTQEQMSSLLFEDQSGHKQTLYIASRFTGGNIKEFDELPPVPPVDAFDVRYVSGRFIETLNPAGDGAQEFPIRMQSLSYPVKVSLNEAGVSEMKYELSTGKQKVSLAAGIPFEMTEPASAMKLIVHPSGGSAIPHEFALYQNYPNPFNPSTVIKYDLPTESYVRLTVSDVLGKVVATLIDEQRPAGYHHVEWRPEVASGLYFYTLNVTNVKDPNTSFRQIRKLLFLK